MAQQTRPGEGTTSPFATQSSPSLSPGVSVPQVSPSGQSATTSGSSESPSGSGGSGNTTTPGVFGRLLNTLRPPLNRTYTAQSGSIRKSGKATKGKRRNSSPPRPGSANSGSMQSGRDSPQASMPVRSLSAVQGETSVNDIASISDKASVLSAGSASAQGSRSPAALGRGPPGAFPASSPYASPLAPDAIIQQSLEPHSTPASPAVSPSTSPRLPTTSGATLSVQRPQPERRQSSGKRLAAALTKPLFRRSSSQTGGSGSPAAPNLSSSAASVASGSISGSGRGTASRSRPASTLGSAVQDASSVQNASSASINTRRPWTSSSARSAYSLGAQSTPSPGTETLNQQPGFPSPYFAQATPTNAYPNPFSPSVDCVQALTVLLSQQITATLAQLVPVNLFTAASGLSPQALALGSLPGLSSVSVATSALSDATTSSSAHHTAASSSNAASSSQWNSYSTGGTTVVGFGSFGFISNEQLAASSLSLPTTSVGTVWRTARAYEWLGENGAALNALAASRSNPMTPRPMSGRPSLDGQLAKQDAPDAAERQESVFDFSALVQSVLDVMASTAADAGVELTFYHGSRKADPVARRGPAEKQAASRAQPSSPSQRQTYQYDMQDSQEAFVKGDERGLGIGLVALLKQVIADSRHGASIQVGLSFALTLPPRGDRQQPDRDNEDEDADDTEEDSTPLGTYLCTVEVVHKFALPPSPSLAQPPSATQAAGPAPAKASSPGSLDPTVSAALLQFLRLSFVTLPPRSDSQAYKITCTLPQALHPLRRSPSADPSYRRRGSVSQSKEPSMQELVRFAETSLRGKKVAFHAQEQNDFAQLISYHLSHWGMECSHVAILQDEDSESGPPWDGGAAPRTRLSGLRPDERAHLGRYDSGFGGSDGQSPPTMPSPSINLSADQTAQSQAVPSSYGSRTGGSDHSHPSSAVTSPPLDPTLSFIIVDDDVPTLKRQLISVRNNVPTVQLQNALLAKRPQLQSRRTRSSQAVQRVPQTTVSIIHFTSLANYRQIRELVHATLKTASPMFPLPEVLVIPKPVGPRRLLATLYNAVRRPTLDPSFAPIATSPSSPGGQYFFAGGRPSPAPSSHLNNEFDVAAGQAVAAQRLQQQSQPHYQYYPQPQHPDAASLSAAASHISGPKTPPVPGQQLSNPPSPASPDALEYFSRSAAELGSNASQGIIIQSPDGRPTGLFFQPRAASLYDRAESLRMARGSVSDGDRTSTGSHPRGSPALSGGSGLSAGGQELPSIVIPDNMDYATGVRNLALNSPPGGTTPTPDVPKPEAAKTAEYVGTPNSDLAESLPMQLEPARPAEVPSPASSNFPNDDGSSSSGSLAQQTEIGLARVESRAESAVPEAATGPQKPLSQPSSPRLSASPKPALQRQPTAAPSPTVSKISPSLSGAAESAAKAGAGAPTKAGSSPSAPLARVKAERKSSSRGEKIKKTPSRRPTGTLVPPINVLIVEDNPINQIILSTFLKRKGIKYSVANNGQEAVDSWKGGNFHLVLMDIQLPVKDGIEATQEIRAMERAGNTQGFVSTPSATPGSELSNPISPPVSVVTSPYELPVIIVALTASSLQSDRVNALAAGCNDFLTKPVSLQWLNQKLVEWGSMAYLSGFSSKRRTTISGSVSPLSPQPGQPSIKGKQKDKEALVQKELKAVKQETEEKKEEKKELIEERKEVAEEQVEDAQDAAKEAELVEEIKDGETTLPIAGDA